MTGKSGTKSVENIQNCSYFDFSCLWIYQCLHKIAKDNSKIIIWKISRWRKQKSPPSIEFETWKIVINHLFLFYSFNPLWLLWKFWATFQVVEIGAVILSLHLSSCHSWFPSSFLVIIVEAKLWKDGLGSNLIFYKRRQLLSKGGIILCHEKMHQLPLPFYWVKKIVSECDTDILETKFNCKTR